MSEQARSWCAFFLRSRPRGGKPHLAGECVENLIDDLVVRHVARLYGQIGQCIDRVTYLDQLARSNGLGTEVIGAARTSLDTAERRSGAQRKTALTELAARLNTAAATAGDQAKARLLSTAVTELANAQR